MASTPQHSPPEQQHAAPPRFYLTPKRPLNPGAVLLAFVLALGVLVLLLHALQQTRTKDAASGDNDDPSLVDTIYLGGPDQAPVAKRPATKPDTVHPFITVRLPRSGDGAGQIPDTPAGRLLFAWLAAFNGTDPAAVGHALPTPAAGLTQAAQTELRRETGGFRLLSAREVQPGVLVFRLHDQTPSFTDALGTLQVAPGPGPPRIASFSLRAVTPLQAKVP